MEINMNEYKIAFIICTNNELYCNECIYYLSQLVVPEGYEIDILTIHDATGINAAYNEALRESDAKYKVYLHQDLFIINKNFIVDILDIFKDAKIGMIGFAGIEKAKDFFINGWRWTKGKPYVDAVNIAYALDFGKVQDKYERVQAIDGMCMVTQYDLSWREEKYTGWHFYDFVHSMEFLQNGYEIVVPNQEKPWMIHDHGIISYAQYNYWLKVFMDEYKEYINK